MQPVYSRLHCQFLSHVLNALFFYQNSPKIKLFLQKNAKFSSAGGSAPIPSCLQRLGALPQNFRPPAGGGSAPRPTKQPPSRISGYAPDMTRLSCTTLLSPLNRGIFQTKILTSKPPPLVKFWLHA